MTMQAKKCGATFLIIKVGKLVCAKGKSFSLQRYLLVEERDGVIRDLSGPFCKWPARLAESISAIALIDVASLVNR